MRPRSLLVRYAAGLAFAYLLSAAEVVAIVISVSGETVVEAQSVLSGKNLVATVAIIIVGTVTVWMGGVALVARALHQPSPARETTPPRQRKTSNITRRQSAILLTPWAVAAVVMIPLNIDGGIRVLILIASAIMFGATATVCKGFLFTQRALRSLMVAATTDFEHAEGRREYGLQERDRLRDLFGRHFGEEVVRRAVEENESVSEDEREVAILFIDLVGSTQLAAAREPNEVAAVLNGFFRLVVAEVDKRNGLINKFQGDFALAVFGAPLRIDGPASAALATARALDPELRRFPVDFGIGVSAGPVFAGNIGAEDRYEYPVGGDAVNEAARLADRAKDFDGRVLCSAAAISLG